MTSPVAIAVLLGSTSVDGVGGQIQVWFAQRSAARDDIKLDMVRMDAPTDQLSAAVDNADAVVIITPEYNHSFPGPLKAAIDSLRREWFSKPVGFVTYGGISGGQRAAEALRVVFGELHTVTVRDTISFAGADAAFDHEGNPRDGAGADGAFEQFVDVLVWWARTVRAGRDSQPYPA